jgi:hypothetical protein
MGRWMDGWMDRDGGGVPARPSGSGPRAILREGPAGSAKRRPACRLRHFRASVSRAPRLGPRSPPGSFLRPCAPGGEARHNEMCVPDDRHGPATREGPSRPGPWAAPLPTGPGPRGPPPPLAAPARAGSGCGAVSPRRRAARGMGRATRREAAGETAARRGPTPEPASESLQAAVTGSTRTMLRLEASGVF